MLSSGKGGPVTAVTPTRRPRRYQTLNVSGASPQRTWRQNAHRPGVGGSSIPPARPQDPVVRRASPGVTAGAPSAPVAGRDAAQPASLAPRSCPPTNPSAPSTPINGARLT
jgi:hypothetical protein